MAALTEQTEIHETICEDGISAVIAEMGPYESSTIDIPINREKLDKIKARDQDPVFVTIEIESCSNSFSKSKRRWPARIIEKVSKQVNDKKPVGNLGHLEEKQYDTHFPEPQVVWLGSTTRSRGNEMVMYAKGYVLPGAKARTYLENDAIDSVSLFGDSTLRPTKGGYEVVEFDLESIDFTRKGRGGMKSRIVSVTGEQASRGGNTVEPKDIAALDESEIRTHAPLLVKEIERQATEPIQTKIGEMTATAEAAKPELDILGEIRKLLKLSEGENPVEKLQALLAKVDEAATRGVKDFIKELVAKKVKNENAQNIVNRMIGEMHTEYTDKDFNDDLKKQIETDLDARIEGDEDIKAVIGEMAPVERERDQGRGGADLGGRSAPSDDRKNSATETDNFTRQKRVMS
jgi:hypothetical protein